MNTDTKLLRRYVDARCESAFTELVQRHIGLVYSVALRRVGGDAQLAEDVAQKVFADLGRKAASLTGHASLSGWLYAGAHVASAAVVRSERRRKHRELEAHTMHLIDAPQSDADGARLRPVIDDAIVTLKHEEREAIALRFFEQRSFAEVGAALRVTEEAARKRVDRALDKLRLALARRGVTSTAAAVGLTLNAIGAEIAPAGVAARVASQALAAGAASSTSALSTVLATAWPAAAALVLGGAALVHQHQTNRGLAAEIGQLGHPPQLAAALRAENRQLARTIAEAEAYRRQIAAAPVSRATATPAPLPAAAPATRRVAARVVITPERTLAWNGEEVTLADFVQRLKALQATADPEARLVVEAPGAAHDAMSYVIDEVQKAGIAHLTVESDAKPNLNPRRSLWWF